MKIRWDLSYPCQDCSTSVKFIEFRKIRKFTETEKDETKIIIHVFIKLNWLKHAQHSTVPESGWGKDTIWEIELITAKTHVNSLRSSIEK